MRLRLHAMLASSVVGLALASPVSFAQQTVPASGAESTNLWFVEMAGKPAADGNALTRVRAEKAEFRKVAKAAGVSFTERRSFDTLFNGFSVAINSANRERLARLPGVAAMYPIFRVDAPSPEEAAGTAPDLVAAITMTGAKEAQDSRGLTGNKIRVGIIDSGIDVDHPAFGGLGTPGTTPFPSTRVAYGYDFVGDGYDAGGLTGSTTPVPDNNPDDCGGHGTHVSGIVGGNGGGIVGVAPGVTFGAYRVFGCNGSTSSDILLAALERAYADKMQVINQSLGAGRQWPEYPTAKASSLLAKKGVIMVASIGNNGPGGSSPDALFAAGAPGVGNEVIGVASYDNAQLSFAVAATPFGYNAAAGSPFAPTSGTLELAQTGTPATVDDACTPLPAGSLSGKAALVRRGFCSFFLKATNAEAAGASAIVLYNNAPGALAPTVAGTPAITVPVVAITADQGATLSGLITGGTTNLDWTSDYVSFPYGTGGLISGFSSYGLNAELRFKPNLGAPGGGIVSSFPLELGGIAALSGTSMSSPHVAGAVALILQAKGKVSPTVMARLLQNTADPKPWSGNAALGFLDFAHRQGAGMLDIIGVLDSKTILSPEHLNVGESQGGAKTFAITVNNKSSVGVTYDLSHVRALASGPNTQSGASYNISGAFDAPATVTLSTPTLFVPARTTAKFNVTIDANPGLPNRSIYGGYIVVAAQGGGEVTRVPFAGFKGDYQSTIVLTPTANGFPWLATLAGGFYTNQPAGALFTMTGGDIPHFLIHLDHLSRRVKLEAFDAVSGTTWHLVSNDQYVTRNSTPGGFFDFTWDGTTFKTRANKPPLLFTVPDGQYVIKVSVLKALGNTSNPADWETWTSPVVTIDRP